MKIKLFIAAFALLMGIFLGKNTGKVEQVEIDDIVIEKVITAPEVVAQSTDQSTCDSSDELLKAKEYYGKAFSLFLAALGVRLNTDKKNELKQMLENPTHYAESNKNNDTSVSIPRELDFTPTDWFKDFVNKEKAELKSIDDDALLDDVQKFMLKDPQLFFARSKYITTFPKIKKMVGEYRAKLYRITGEHKGEIENVSMVINFDLKDEKEIEGRFELKLSRDGAVYSNAAGNGSNGNVRIREGSILIEAGPNRFFHFLTDSISTANFYENGKLAGIARFKKIN